MLQFSLWFICLYLKLSNRIFSKFHFTDMEPYNSQAVVENCYHWLLYCQCSLTWQVATA